MSRTTPSRPAQRTRRLLASISLLLALLLGGTFGTGAAQAGTDSFCNGAVPSGSVCPGPSHSLTAVRGTNNDYGAGCGGAVGYGSYYCATPAGCHTYSGTNVLTPGIRHRSTGTRNMSGYSTWGSTGPPTNCVSGSPYAVDGPLAGNASYIEGVPVMDRATTTAPEDVAALVPAADPTTARRFDTPQGAAWLLVDGTNQQLCLVADDGGTGYGVSCQRFGAARDQGSIETFEDDNTQSAAGDVVIAIMPEGVDEVTVDRADGSERTVAAKGGVVVTTLAARDRAVELAAATPDDGAPQLEATQYAFRR